MKVDTLQLIVLPGRHPQQANHWIFLTTTIHTFDTFLYIPPRHLRSQTGVFCLNCSLDLGSKLLNVWLSLHSPKNYVCGVYFVYVMHKHLYRWFIRQNMSFSYQMSFIFMWLMKFEVSKTHIWKVEIFYKKNIICIIQYPYARIKMEFYRLILLCISMKRAV